MTNKSKKARITCASTMSNDFKGYNRTVSVVMTALE